MGGVAKIAPYMALTVARKPPLWPTLFKRLPLVVVAVVVCYQFSWEDLRYITSEIVLRFAEWRGLQAERLGPHLVFWNGELYRFDIACTFVDVFCGAIPLIWVWRFGVVGNLMNVAGFAAALFAFNLFRDCVADLVFSAGAPWFLADQVVGGAAYFAVWVCIVRWLEYQEICTTRFSQPVHATRDAWPRPT
jgi:hypothetical protein